jgi:RHS repeat-associated protein
MYNDFAFKISVNDNIKMLKKLRKTVTEADTQANTHSMGSFQYNNSTLQYIQTSEGYVRHTPPSSGTNYGAFDYVYNYTDHLGNVRLSYTLDPSAQEIKILEENHYYPFGMKHTYNTSRKDIRVDDAFLDPNAQLDPAENGNRRVEMVSNTGYQYKYNGKEYQDELGLNTTAMDFRHYDAAIGRFNGMDRLAELAYSITPYRFGFNNPNYWADPTGLFENDGGNALTLCESCPKTFEYLPYLLNPFINYDYDADTGIVTTIIELDNVVVGPPSNEPSNTNSSSSSWWSSLFYFHNGVELWGKNRFGDLGGNKRGTIKHSIEDSDIPNYGSGSVARAKGVFIFWKWFLINIVKNEVGGTNRVIKLKELIIEKPTRSSMEVQNIESVVPPPQAIDTIFLIRYQGPRPGQWSEADTLKKYNLNDRLPGFDKGKGYYSAIIEKTPVYE